jgi:hypothetical protein
MIGSKYLTEETAAQEMTFPGQAHFAIVGTKTRCRECVFWSPRHKDDKQAICRKAAMLTFRTQLAKVPGHAWICKYFEEKPA